jgi:hypothetical protein
LGKQIVGVADGARSHIIAGSREHLGFVPKFEHPRTPFSYRLDEVGDAPDTPKAQSASALAKTCPVTLG